MSYFLNNRKQRYSKTIRNLVSQVSLNHQKFVQPIFVKEGILKKEEIANFNKIYNDTTDSILSQIEQDINQGTNSFLLFVNQKNKDDNPTNFDFQSKVINKIKSTFGNDIFLSVDVCLCGITHHGHCGILLPSENEIDNDKSVKTLANIALEYAKSGADSVAPSDMNDGTSLAIRETLNKNKYDSTLIIDYSTKFHSHLYGPFRTACDSSPSKNTNFKNRSTYQIDFRNTNDALKSSLDTNLQKVVDILMIKPSSLYLDIIHQIKQNSLLPIAAYHVSGEYMALEYLAKNGIGDRKGLHLEAWTSLSRAGADIIISYASRHAKKWISEIDNL